ncbi:MAG: galactokinase family protein [Bacteroidota bacterium]
MDILQNFLDKRAIEARLRAGGIASAALDQVAKLFQDVARTMCGAGLSADSKVIACWVPGRIEVLGKHTDYAGGSSLLTASERGFAVLVCPGQTNDITMLDAGRGVACTFNPQGDVAGELPPWALYPQTVIKRIRANFDMPAKGGVIGFSSNVPRAAGMSSSSALIIVTFLGLSCFGPLEKHPGYLKAIKTETNLADYLGHIENGKSYKQLIGDGGVGTLGGSQDHTAIVCAKPRHILHAAFQPTRVINHVPLPEDLVFCVGVSGVRAKKTGAAKAAYNAASTRVTNILSWWNGRFSHHANSLADIVADESFDSEVVLSELGAQEEGLLDRFVQFVRETTQHIPGAVEALQHGDQLSLGVHVRGSLADAVKRLGNQVPETIALAGLARPNGAVAASAFGAGYGGSVWALVDKAQAAVFLDKWEAAYRQQYPAQDEASFFIDETGPAAFKLSSVA